MAETIKSTILAPDGSLADTPTVILSDEDAALLRAYKKFLLRNRLREALFCQACWDQATLADGCEAHVTPSQILIRCRCTTRFYQGSSF